MKELNERNCCSLLMIKAELILPLCLPLCVSWRMIYLKQRFRILLTDSRLPPLRQVCCKSVSYKDFFIQEIADILSGHDIYERERIDGQIPYITATANNNGIGYFVANINETLEENCLSVNRNGSVGYCHYHPYKALYGNDTRKLRPHVPNKYISLYISEAISSQRCKYGYGYKMGTGRLKRQKIMLPVTSDGNPDWAYMEAYMRGIESIALLTAIKHFANRFPEYISA